MLPPPPVQRVEYDGNGSSNEGGGALTSVQLASMTTSVSPALYSSTNSSLAPPGPRERTSLMTTCPMLHVDPPEPDVDELAPALEALLLAALLTLEATLELDAALVLDAVLPAPPAPLGPNSNVG